METATAAIPLSIADRLLLGTEMRVSADWDEFLDVLPRCDYRIEYDQGQIISFMGFASEQHEQLVMIIADLLRQTLPRKQYSFFASNLALHMPGTGKHYFNADCTVVKGSTEKIPLGGNMYAVANPIILVEVLSPSTGSFDLTRKSRLYREIPSLQQLLFIDSTEMAVTLLTRQDEHTWHIQDFSQPTDRFPVLDAGTISVADLYEEVKF